MRKCVCNARPSNWHISQQVLSESCFFCSFLMFPSYCSSSLWGEPGELWLRVPGLMVSGPRRWLGFPKGLREVCGHQ